MTDGAPSTPSAGSAGSTGAPPGAEARRLAIAALTRIDTEGAYANLLLPQLLADSDLSTRDRAFVTELVYGVTRRRRSLDWLVDPYLLREVDPDVRAALRLGAYQLLVLGTPPHAAVSATVDAVPKRVRGFVNAVLRKVAGAVDSVRWPDTGTRLGYPDWVVDRLQADLGPDRALGALEAMNEAAEVTERPDGYVQDLASQWVAAEVGAVEGERVLDLCAAPGGKATALAEGGARVVAADVRPGRVFLLVDNVERLGLRDQVAVVGADGSAPPFRPGSFDRVLVDAPCSGLGALRRRPDARWRVQADAVHRLARLQRRLLEAALALVRPGGTLVYSVCTLTEDESVGVADALTRAHPELEVLPPPAEPWVPWGTGGLLLPQAAGTDGMALFRWRVPA